MFALAIACTHCVQCGCRLCASRSWFTHVLQSGRSKGQILQKLAAQVMPDKLSCQQLYMARR